jgi:hypothetical protein
MVLQGAEILFYPTAIGSEPQDTNLDSREHWKRVMQGHAGANLVLLLVSLYPIVHSLPCLGIKRYLFHFLFLEMILLSLAKLFS